MLCCGITGPFFFFPRTPPPLFGDPGRSPRPNLPLPPYADLRPERLTSCPASRYPPPPPGRAAPPHPRACRGLGLCLYPRVT